MPFKPDSPEVPDSAELKSFRQKYSMDMALMEMLLNQQLDAKMNSVVGPVIEIVSRIFTVI